MDDYFVFGFVKLTFKPKRTMIKNLNINEKLQNEFGFNNEKKNKIN